MPNDVKENSTFATVNAIQVKIDNNIRMLAELHAIQDKTVVYLLNPIFPTIQRMKTLE